MREFATGRVVIWWTEGGGMSWFAAIGDRDHIRCSSGVAVLRHPQHLLSTGTRLCRT